MIFSSFTAGDWQEWSGKIAEYLFGLIRRAGHLLGVSISRNIGSWSSDAKHYFVHTMQCKISQQFQGCLIFLLLAPHLLSANHNKLQASTKLTKSLVGFICHKYWRTLNIEAVKHLFHVLKRKYIWILFYKIYYKLLTKSKDPGTVSKILAHPP